MHRISVVTLLRLVLVLGWPVGAWAQEFEVTRGPRFLVAAASSKAPPVAVNASRNVLLRKVVSLNFERSTVEQVLTSIEQQTGLKFFYSRENLRPDRPVALRADRITVAAALMDILVDTGVDVLLSGGMQIVLIKRSQAGVLWQGGSIVGQVTDTATGRGVGGTDIFLEGTQWRAQTDTNGRYRLADVDTGTYTLTARRLGYLKQSRRVAVRAGHEDTVHLKLAPMAVTMNELVTTATGEQRRRDIGNAITTIRADSVLQSAPIRNLTDLLEDRVPGLTVQHTSGAPGDPARIRLRGIGSVTRSNDPVVIVDGVRMYAAQSDPRSGNLTNLGCAKVTPTATAGRTACQAAAATLPAPSPLDQIDPNTIEKIQVFKGPSAATLYGADAANGVIVVTTKQGRPGPARWNARATYGRTTAPGRWPEGYYRWGHLSERGGSAWFCPLTETSCEVDSLVRFQALNDPSLTVLGEGRRAGVSLTASGGSQALTYSVTGTYSDETGLLLLPAYEAERFRDRVAIDPPEWMRRPHHLKNWSVTSNVAARLGATADVSLRTSLSRMDQQRSTLETQIRTLAGAYVDRVNGVYYAASTVGGAVLPITSLIQSYSQRTTASSINFATGLGANWRPRSWINAGAQAGINVIPREDEKLVPSGFVSPGDSGSLNRGTGRSIVGTFNIQGTMRRSLPWGFNFETSIGANLQTTTTNDVIISANGLQPGTSTFNGASLIQSLESRADASTFGWYLEPRIVGQRISFSTGLRLDGGSAYGTRLTGAGGNGSFGLPKLNGSWVISEEPFFPFKSFFSSLRLRGAYGQSQVQPGPADRLRTYTRRFTSASTGDHLIRVVTVGNSDLRPERSVEFEGGIDADMLDSRMSLEVTAYRKTQVDAIMPVQLPPSVNGGGLIQQNIGNVRNLGLEVVVAVTPVQTPVLTWNTQLIYNRNTNTVVKLGDGVASNRAEGRVEGYPVGGRWARPILGYTDANGNGVIDRSEILLGDSLVYMGRLQPAYTTSLFTNIALFGGAVGITAGFSYESGGTQVDETARTNWVLSPALLDPSSPFSEQAAALALDSTEYGMTQDVSTFRFNSLSINYRAPTRVARLLQAQQLMVAIQGSNLGLHSTYRGKDPDVSAWSPGESIRDTGQLPLPRTWQLALSLQY